MKQVKFWVLTLVVLIGVGLTSCMNSDNNTTSAGYAVVKVRSTFGTTYFEDVNGFKLYPSMISLSEMEASPINFKTSSTNMAYIGYQYDTSTQPITENTTKLNVELFYAVGLDTKFELVNEPGALNDSIAKAPILSLKGTLDGAYAFEPIMFDDNTLLLSVNYYMNNELHYFTLVSYANSKEESENGNTITLYLRHNNGEDTSTNATSLGYLSRYPYVFYKAFDLSSLRLKPGDKLIIKTMESPNSVKLEDAKENSYEVVINSEE